MDKKEITQEIIDSVDSLIAKTEESLEFYKKIREGAKKEQLESEPPKLRHGDYGFNYGGWARIAINCEGKNGLMQVGSHNMPMDGCQEKMSNAILGNIFDDLAEMSKDLDEFEVGCDCGGSDKIKVTCLPGCCDECVYIKINDSHSIHLHGNSLHEFILNLRRTEATLKRRTTQ